MVDLIPQLLDDLKQMDGDKPPAKKRKKGFFASEDPEIFTSMADDEDEAGE